MNDDTGRTVDLMGRIASHSLSATRGLQIQKFGGTARDITWLSRTNCVTKMCTEELSLELWERHSEAALKPVNMEVKPEVVKNINKMKHEVLVASKMRCRSEEKEACRVGQCVDRTEDINGIVQQSLQQTKTEVAVRSQRFVTSDVIVAFSPDQYEVRGWTVTRIGQYGCAGCFTKPVSKGIHRLTITTEAEYVRFGVIDADEYPKYLTSAVHNSRKAMMMQNDSGYLFSAGSPLAYNTRPEPGQSWSAEADLEERTLHFFVNGVQQQHHFTHIPVPLVFAIETSYASTTVEFTFWGELNQSSVTFEGTGHYLG
ncbi:hypothetical protein BLNAU_14488 [Blattamonas nauphoetae]|uniref:SPRY domain-containing protein n=1 Tax=Blattamonas nauphoetae TaxID=2049346 RepID=A0ABQ9XF58_9EUKA|nr:hypothetical protein BLNAU_14488 [Blattamonas nauphoetae]